MDEDERISLEASRLAHRHLLARLLASDAGLSRIDELAGFADMVEAEGGDIRRASAYRAELGEIAMHAAATIQSRKTREGLLARLLGRLARPRR